jgi:outer membrane protein TolC
MRVLVAVAFQLVAQVQGSGIPAAPDVAAPAAAAAAPTFTTPAPAVSSAPTDASALIALPEPKDGRKVLSLDDVLAAAAADAFDVRIAAEHVVQQEANLRRAWSAVLPQLALNGAYTLTCSGGGKDIANCNDLTTVLVDPKQLQSEANLFDGISSLLGIAAAGTTDPGEKQKLLDQQAALDASSQQVREAAKLAKPVVVQPANVFAGSISLSVPLFNGRAFPLLLNAYDSVELAGKARDQVRDGLSYSAERAYFAALAAKKLVQIAQDQADSAHKHTEATRARVETATQPRLALDRAELDSVRADEGLEQAKAAYDIAVAGLGLIAHKQEAFDVADPTAASPAPKGSVDDLATLALAHRADVAAERLSLGIAKRSELDAWMMFAPSVNLVASAHATSFTSGFIQDPITGSLAITATLPLYDGGARYAALDDSASRIREETMREKQLEERVRAQVLGNVNDLPRREAALGLARRAADVAKTAHDQAQASFDAGVGTSLDVSDTELALVLAQNDLVKAELDLALADAGLRYVVGAPLR